MGCTRACGWAAGVAPSAPEQEERPWTTRNRLTPSSTSTAGRSQETVLNHLECAAEELPLDAKRDARFWPGDFKALVTAMVARGKREGRDVLVMNPKPGERA